MMLNPSRTYFRCDSCGKSMPTEGNHNDPGDGTDLCPACFQKPTDRQDGKEGGKAKVEKKAIGQTQPPTAEELRAAAAVMNRASQKNNARKGFGTPAVKAKAIATRQRNAEIRRRLRKEAIARAKLEAKAIIAKLDAEKKARG
jgi:uncharacterized Zn finger protein (UPF0148 family)